MDHVRARMCCLRQTTCARSEIAGDAALFPIAVARGLRTLRAVNLGGFGYGGGTLDRGAARGGFRERTFGGRRKRFPARLLRLGYRGVFVVRLGHAKLFRALVVARPASYIA